MGGLGIISRREACSSMLFAGTMAWLHARRGESATTPVAMASDESTKWIVLVAFPELTLLDLVGPLQVLRGLDAPFRTAVVAEDLDPVLTDTGVRITPQMMFADVPRPYVVLIPGGPGSVAAMATGSN